MCEHSNDLFSQNHSQLSIFFRALSLSLAQKIRHHCTDYPYEICKIINVNYTMGGASHKLRMLVSVSVSNNGPPGYPSLHAKLSSNPTSPPLSVDPDTNSNNLRIRHVRFSCV